MQPAPAGIQVYISDGYPFSALFVQELKSPENSVDVSPRSGMEMHFLHLKARNRIYLSSADSFTLR